MTLLQAVCERHTHVIPVETYLQKDSDVARQREIIRLQQQARVLTTELEERKKLETAMRAALAAQPLAETELRQAQEDIREFLENAVEGLHWVGPDDRILWANRAEAEMLGYSREEYIGRHISEVHADASAIEDILARLARNEKLVSYHRRHERDVIPRNRKAIYGRVGPIGARDQADALRAFAAQHSYVDLTRVAIYGTSGGGSATLNALFRYPDL